MNQIKAGTILSYIQIAVKAVITLLYTPILLKVLGQSEYGLYNTVASIVTMLSLLRRGFSGAYIRFYTKYQKKEDGEAVARLNGLFLLLLSFSAIVVLICGIWISRNLNIVFSNGLTFNEYKTAEKLMILLTVNLALSFIMSVFTCIINAKERFAFLKIVELLKAILEPCAVLVFLFLGLKSVGVIFGILLVSFLADIVYLIYAFGVLHIKIKFREIPGSLFKVIISYVILISLHFIVDQINWNVDKIVLGRFRGTRDVAIYSVGFSLYSHYLTAGLPVASLHIPRAHKIVDLLIDNKDKLRNQLTELMIKVGRIQFLILAPIAMGFIVFGKSLICFWVGDAYEQAYYVSLILIVSGSIDLIQNLGIEIQRALGKQSFRSGVYALMAVINIGVSISLCQKYGAIGCTIGTALSLILVQGLVINVYYHKKCYINILKFWKALLVMMKGLPLPFAIGILLKLCRLDKTIKGLFVSLTIFLFFYVTSMYCFGINRDEKEKVKKMIFIFRK